MLTVNSLLGQSRIEEAAQALAQPEAKPFFLTLLARLKALAGDKEAFRRTANGKSGIDNGRRAQDVDERGTESSEDDLDMPNSRSPPRPSNGDQSPAVPSLSSPISALHALEEIRDAQRLRMRSLKLGFRLVHTLRRHLLRAGVLRSTSGARTSGAGVEEETVAFMCACLKGRLSAKEGKRMVEGVRCVDFSGILKSYQRSFFLSPPSDFVY